MNNLGFITNEITASLGQGDANEITLVGLGLDPSVTQQVPSGTTGEQIGAAAVAVVGLAALFAFGFFYNRWAYDDWTCMFKNCVQTSSKRK